MKHNVWYRGKVISGKKLGRVLGYPTLNLDNPETLSGKKEGVYAVSVIIDKKKYYGVLFFGPRLTLSETGKIIEIFLFDFHKQIYGTVIKFQLISFIRPPSDFSGLKALQNQIKADVKRAKEIIRSLQS